VENELHGGFTGIDHSWLVVEPYSSEKYESVGMMTFPKYGKS
jgi:hypothetical protein